MTDLNKERELYESVIEKTQDLKMVHLVGISFNEEKNQYEAPGEKWACELTDACLELNTGWFIWQECVKAKAQAVPEGYVLMPKVPSEKMFQAYERYSVAPMSTLSKTGYKAMVEAAGDQNENS
ncbi:hypothetical protein [Acinetobacter sp. WU_MDCI_Abxc22]|uniref:hypothetical protein n=1 Tax=Acinetobacter sp. WU_MDCI_Abxc22 TaxID=2850071 RepID=UPI0021CD1DC8|nr:hypothetical protein [Acinetobacter sp. WU_MDCI_Abxc22]MCU4362629.1 hypothetical protein [Acinetobacter sp. WU_MDCI_Abxc22]